MKKYLLNINILLCLFCTTSFAQDFNCLDCHDNVIANTAHDKAVKCGDCHQDVSNENHIDDGALNVKCGKCHTAFEKQVNNDVHHRLLKLSANDAPTCKTCHGTHNINSPSAIKDKSKAFCGKCHKENVLSVPYHTLNIVNDNCLNCHKNKDYKLELVKSVHEKLSCSNCHGYVVNNMTSHEKEPQGGPTADCYLCHTSIANEHKESIHGISLSEGINEAAQCWDCHGSHSIYKALSDSSKVFGANLVSTCASCHDDIKFVQDHDFAIKQPGLMYLSSVHGKLAESGRLDVPTCSSCHGIHNIKNRVQLGSKISSVNLPETCAECHKKITEEYKQSIHWVGVKKGVRESPTCNDCHSEHSIQAIGTVGKREKMKIMQEQTCLHCHQSLILSERYSLESKNSRSYQDSYHGLAVKRGDNDAALCIDCHGVHNIQPKYHEESTINKKNVLQTCKKCHINATEVFADSYSHVTEIDSKAAFVENIVGTIYFWLIIIVVGGMVLHNLIIFIFDLRERRKLRNKEIKIPRFTTNELIQHYILFISFSILAITGFQLKYPDSWWSEELSYLGLNEVIRQYVHRISAIVMTALSLYHFFYLIFTERGRSVLKSLWPRYSDIKLAKDTILFYLGLKKKHPEYDNYNYIEKVEYWALIWGTIIMGATGLVLWFPTIVGDWAPVWFIKVSESIHFYEAILATLSIIIWHWFFVVFRPQEYPLSFTCIDGKMTILHFKDEHNLKYKKIIAEWVEIKYGKRSQKQLSNFYKIFTSSIIKAGINLDEFFQKELDNDEQLKAFVEKQNLLK